MRLTLLGSGDARQLPVYNCHCPACALMGLLLFGPLALWWTSCALSTLRMAATA